MSGSTQLLASDGTVLEITEGYGANGYRLVVRARHPTESEHRFTVVFEASGQPKLAIQRIFETWLAGNTRAMGKKLELVRKAGNNRLRQPGTKLIDPRA